MSQAAGPASDRPLFFRLRPAAPADAPGGNLLLTALLAHLFLVFVHALPTDAGVKTPIQPVFAPACRQGGGAMRKVVVLRTPDGKRIPVTLENWGMGVDRLYRRWTREQDGWHCAETSQICQREKASILNALGLRRH